MAPKVSVEPGIDRAWLTEVARGDPISHAWALWDLDHAPDRVRFLTVREGGRPVAYLLFWYGMPDAPVVHWVGAAEPASPMLNELPPRPMIAIVPSPVAAAVVTARAPAVSYPLLIQALPGSAPTPSPGPVPARRLTRSDRPALAELARSFGSLLTLAYASIDPGLEPVFGIFAQGRLAGVARVQVTLPAVWVIGGIFTVPEHRGRGLGRSLTAAATAEARAAGAIPALAVREENAPAVHLYQSIGYTTVDRRAWVDAGVERSP